MGLDLQALKDELTIDPLGRGYSGMNDVQAAESLNTPDREPERETITAGLLMGGLVEAEYDALPSRGKTYFDLVVSAGEVPLTDEVKTNLGSLFPAGSATRANVLAAMKRPGSRAEELGMGRVTESDVADARRL